jgi:hypothetical protein
MDIVLIGDHAGAHHGVAGMPGFQYRGGAVVTRTFDAQNQHENGFFRILLIVGTR